LVTVKILLEVVECAVNRFTEILIIWYRQELFFQKLAMQSIVIHKWSKIIFNKILMGMDSSIISIQLSQFMAVYWAILPFIQWSGISSYSQIILI
jgi:hypothetical protein